MKGFYAQNTLEGEGAGGTHEKQKAKAPITRSLRLNQSELSQSIEIFRSSLKSESIFPVPSTTEASGSSAIDTGNPVSSRMRLSRFLISAPPPVKTMPRSLISAEGSGGGPSNATRMAFKIDDTPSARASRVSLWAMV